MEVDEGVVCISIYVLYTRVVHMPHFAFFNLINYFTTGNLFMMSEIYMNEWDAGVRINAAYFCISTRERTLKKCLH